ncbi:hypothetical protein GGR50DRAFT_416065 [Xylaria sp. CBS 124048]|nr:hypothetical protein GGR50DRAFT_416065 [Xylaria sp. CBS 124048]
MFRALVLPPKGSSLGSRPGPKRSYHVDNHRRPSPHGQLLNPACWSIAACGAIYFGCAAWEVYQDAKRAKAKDPSWTSQCRHKAFEQLERLRENMGSTNPDFHQASSEYVSERPEFGGLARPRVLTVSIMGLTAYISSASRSKPALERYVIHFPASSRNYTLLTTLFGSGSRHHLGVKLVGIWWLMPKAGNSLTFRESNPHLTAFYLTAGILSSFAQHTASLSLSSARRVTAVIGASGAMLALFGIVCVSYPQSRLEFFTPPHSVSIAVIMAIVALYSAVGIVFPHPRFRFAHASHLFGLGFGVMYARRRGDKTVWRPARRAAFIGMQSLRVL